MDAIKGALGAVEEGEGAQGSTLQRRCKQMPLTHPLIISSLPGTVVADAAVLSQPCWLSSCFTGRTLNKRECRGGGKGILWFQCAK